MSKYKLDSERLGYDTSASAIGNTENFEVMLQGVYRQVRHSNKNKRKRSRMDGKTPNQTQIQTKTRTVRNIRTDATDDDSNDNGKGNIQILKLTAEERSELENTMLFCFGSLFKFDATLVGGEKFTSTAQMRATPPPVALVFGRDPMPMMVVDVNVLPDTPLIYGRTSSSIWGEVHPYLEVPINLHYAWRLLNYEEIFAVIMRYGLKRCVTEIGHSLGYKGTATRPVNSILNRALLKLAPALLDLPIHVTVEGLE
jgi:hypothetical protein